jgi:hypothetical protein
MVKLNEVINFDLFNSNNVSGSNFIFANIENIINQDCKNTIRPTNGFNTSRIFFWMK